VSTLINAQMRIDHAESAMAVIGKVPEGKRIGNTAWFRAEIGDLAIIEKVLRGYLTHVSVQVDSDDVECSKCKKPTRKEGMLVHLCPGAWEIVHKPKVRELSIVASPAYKTTEFHPVGFAAAMNDSQYDAILKNIQNSQLSEDNKDVGSRQKEPQEPENKKSEAKKEVKHLPEQNAQQGASPHNAQGVVNVAPGESAPKQVTYQELIDQVTKLEKQIREGPSASDSELDALTKKVAELESEIGKRATKRSLSKKLSDLTKQLQTPTEEGESGEGEAGFPPKAEGATIPTLAEAEAQKNAGKASGKGIVAIDEIQKDVLGNYDWFKDILKAHRMLQTQTFKG
jgi:hypothetical protein